MRRFEFRLDSVLKLQERRKRVAELHRQQARAAAAAAEADVARLQQELETMATELHETLGADVGKWQAVSERTRWLGTALAVAEQRVRDARVRFLQANEHYRQRAVAVEALAHLRHTRWQEYQDAVASDEQQRIEEFVLRRWVEDADKRGKDAI